MTEYSAEPVPEPAVAGMFRRAVAIVIDTFIAFAVLGFAVGLATGDSEASGGSVSFNLNGKPAVVWILLAFAYFIVLEKLVGGTLGKLLLGMRVRTETGEPIGWGASLIRNLLRIVDGFFCYVIGAIVAWTSPRRQRLGDRAAGTIVVRSSSSA